MWEEGDTADDHCHGDENKRPLSLILKWLYTALNIKMGTNSETKKGRGFGLVRDRLMNLV
jgi:hypothetical protein